MKINRLALVILLCSALLSAGKFPDINISYKKYILQNGLTLLVHEDHKAPIVAVNIWYHVGSKNEKPGKTGFAHLFEHLMFNGSEHYNTDYFQALERMGATDLNGTTSDDRTNYFQNVPKSALDGVLWLESDRMGSLIKAITQEKLDEQRGVVQNEKRQGENEPYAVANELITKNTYPAGHPYSWTVIGSMEDLNAAKLEDVHEWFKTYYGPNNAVLTIAGDITFEEAKSKAEKYFAAIPPGPPVAHHLSAPAKMTGTKRQKVQDRVPQAKLIKVWNMPEWKSKEVNYLDLVSDVMASGKTSRLYKRLVYDEQIATNVSCSIDPKEIGGQFVIEALAKPGVPLEKIEKAIDEELNQLIRKGISVKELERVKNAYYAAFVRRTERIGGFGGKSDILAQNQVFAGDPDYYKTSLKFIENATAKDLQSTAAKWLSDGVYILEVLPFPEASAAETDADRNKMPQMGESPDPKFPSFTRKKLSNGLTLLMAKRSDVPVLNFSLLVNSGFAADQFAVPGTANVTMDMLDEGTKSRNALALSEELSMLGATLRTTASMDYCSVSMSALKSSLDKSLVLYADVIMNPSFPQKELDRIKKEKMNQIKREKASPVSMGMRVFSRLLFGEGHAYGAPFSGTGYEKSIQGISVEDLRKFRDTWFKPDNSTLIVTGDFDETDLVNRIEKLFKEWKKGSVPKKNVAEVTNVQSPVIYLLDKPGSEQSVILAGEVAPKKGEDDIAVETMDNILGGVFTSRINMNLREDKHWSYGSGSSIINTQAQRPYMFYGLVQTDKTKESIQEMYKEIRDIKSTKPAGDDEVEKNKQNQLLQLPGTWETSGRVLSSLVEMVSYGLPDDYFSQYPAKLKSLTKAQVNDAAGKMLFPDNLVWIVVGDKAKIEGGLKAIGYPVKLIDGDGNLLK